MNITPARGIVLAAAVTAVLAAAGCSSSSTPKTGASSSTATTSASSSQTPAASSAAPVLQTAHTALGTILTDSSGMTVYRFAPDTPGKSMCASTCLQYWPAVAAPATVTSSIAGISAPIGSFVRSDGTKQLTVGGYPVYTFVNDTKAGSTNGQGKNLSGGRWWVVSPSGADITAAAPGASTPASGGASSSSGGGGYGYGR